MIIASDNSSSHALLTILYEIWVTDTKAWTIGFKEINQCHLKPVFACFNKYINGQASLKLPEILSDMKFTLRVLHNLLMEPEAQVFQP